MKNSPIIYQGKNGGIELNLDTEQDTIWATQTQIAELFKVDRTSVTRHINNIYSAGELDEKVVCAFFEHTTPHGALKNKTQVQKIKAYSLDMILSVGYRVNSVKATEFRRWASRVLKDYMLRGVAINKKRLSQLNQVLEIASRSEITEVAGVAELIKNYTAALDTLEKYDNNQLSAPKGQKEVWQLTYTEARRYLDDVRRIGEYGDNFANERDRSFDGVVSGIYQTFGGEELYGTVQEKAANLLYQVVKDHPFFDGNKRSAAALFVYFLSKNNALSEISNNTLAAIVLMVALSKPSEKDQMILLIMNLLDMGEGRK